ncbi:MAG: ATP-binding protein [Gelidibacter sp.]
MKTTKRQGLDETYQKFLAVCTNENPHIKSLDPLLLDTIVGLGTTADERMFSKSDFYTMIERQAEQSRGLNMKWHSSPISHRVSKDGNSAVFIDDLTVTMTINGQPKKMALRCTTVFEFDQDKWLVVHCHVSKPEEAESETDTYGIEQWKQKTIELEKIVAERTADLVEKNKELETAIDTLKATQSQLIQSEKLASLGQLAAGIAHEIKNPLNFVNNFSELNLELIEEIYEELKKLPDSPEKEEIKSILGDVVANQKKIHQHGSRADSIVKSMLLHSRGGNGIKEPTDINDMIREYVNLSFHGMRAGKKPINVTLDVQLDESIPKVAVIIEDISRVVLNLCNNAFDAMYERLQMPPESEGYQPKLTVKTYQKDKNAIIEITDNALGIPSELKDKILMPFFTTKKGTEGTGLGLSITDDIIKAHGGDLKIESEQGEDSFTKFIINLPI